MFEINEAFASQAYAVSRDLGLDPEKVNIYGGGISIGHPIGATGTMLTVKVMYELMHTDKKDAMISMCIGGGHGISMYFTSLLYTSTLTVGVSEAIKDAEGIIKELLDALE